MASTDLPTKKEEESIVIKSPISQKREDKEKNLDYDFDFSMYDEEDIEEQEKEENIYAEPPQVSTWRSRFSNGQEELNILAEIKRVVTKKSFLVAARTQDIAYLWQYYGILDEYWASIKDMFGALTQRQVLEHQKRCRRLLEEYENKTPIHAKVHNNLLFLRNVLYRLKQLANLGYEVEKIKKGRYATAIRKIEQ